uniref:Ubiquitin-like domain-containing protein n=1 Tax=Syphacia muris TaxID=451379 RepID=A0A0N5AWS2_9BILA
MAEEEVVEKVNLIIKCALQSFEDTPVQCPLDWTVQQLKQELSVVCPTKPEVQRQRIIYAGHCLHDSRTLRSVFENRPDEDVRVMHLVCPPKEISDFGVRKRRTQKTEAKNPSNNESTQNSNATTSGASMQEATPGSSVANNSWASLNAANPYQMPNVLPANANLQNVYNAYMCSYYTYMQQMWSNFNGNVQSSFVMPRMYFSNLNQYYTFPQAHNLEQQQPELQQQRAPEVQDAAAGGMAQNAIMGDVDAPQRDFLDIVYKAIRLCFLVMLVYIYSSAERFLGVMFFISVAWFIQARRDRNGRAREERELARVVNDVRQQPQSGNGENEGSTASDEEEVPRQDNADDFREPSAWTTFWSICYSFISGFFASLFPEHPAPVNAN